MNDTTSPSLDLRELATLAMRLVAFAAALALVGAFFLPWIRTDGMDEVSSGAELLALLASPTITYLFAISTIQASFLVGCPALFILSASWVMAKYARRKTALYATCLALASAVSVVYGTPDLTAGDEAVAYSGVRLIVALSALLLIHQVAIKLRGFLLRRGKLPTVYQALSVLTGSGFYRWSER